MTLVKRLVVEEEGATAVEYAMIIGLIALATFAVYKFMGQRAFTILNNMQQSLKTANQTYAPTN